MSTVTKQNRDINSLQPVAQNAARLFFDTCKGRGIDIFATEFHRSQERQNYLYEQGRTRPGTIVTWTKTSNHTSGYAWDIAVNPPKDLYDFKIIYQAAEVAKELGIEWGGNWPDSRDTPHFQVDKNWKEPVKDDLEYKKAVTKLSQTSNINAAAWYPVSKINLKNVPALLHKMGGIERLKQDRIISDTLLWTSNTYNQNHVRSLIIKYSLLG